MEKNKLILKEKELLKKIAEDMKTFAESVEYSEADEEKDYDAILAEHEDLGIGNDAVFGQYYFLPTTMEDSEVENFMILLTLSDEMSEEKRVDMLQAITYINYMLPAGAFVFDPMLEILTYKRGVTLLADAQEIDTIAMIGYEIFAALHTVSMFAAPLLAYMNGELTWEEFITGCEIVMETAAQEEMRSRNQ